MIQVISPGLFTTVQDLGRDGYGAMGVSASGAADPVALRLGNRLVGNREGAPALEITLLGPTLLFHNAAVIALAGADLAGSPPSWTAHYIEAGTTLRLGPVQSGARCYFCVRGGLDVPLWLGSASTHILSGLGGYQGRALRKNDVLSIGAAEPPGPPRRLNRALLARLAPRRELRVTTGLQWDWFTTESRQALLSAPYRVTQEANRMGLRLQGPTLELAARREMITEGVPLGAIQIPAGGQPIILFVEQQTTGGYPKIANVVAADQRSVAQLRPGDEIRFEVVSPGKARTLICEQEALLQSEDLFLA